MNKLYRAKIGIAFTALALIFSIFGLLLLNGSTAWYSQNDTVKANGIGVKLQGSAGVTASTAPTKQEHSRTATVSVFRWQRQSSKA